MLDQQLLTPVALFIFNRPDLTIRTFTEIARARPRMLLLVADGPRPNIPGEAEQCAAARAVVGQVDWPCQLLTNFSDVNLGYKKRMASGLDWVFETVTEAIILEDDCVPHPTYFRFSEELLRRYRDDERIMHIAGSNYQFGQRRTLDSYYFSRYTIVGGWASWRRSWQHFDLEMKLWPWVRDNHLLKGVLHDDRVVEDWENRFQAVYTNQLGSIWDLQWWFACWIQNGLAIHPNVNLISNIGFDARATHIKDEDYPFANMPVEAMHFPLTHPLVVTTNAAADSFIQATAFTRWPQRKG